MKTREVKLARGLFTRTRIYNDYEAGEARDPSFKETTAADLVDQYLKGIGGDASSVLRAAGFEEDDYAPHGVSFDLEGNPALASEILGHIRALKLYRRLGDLDLAVGEAMKLVMRWSELEANRRFEQMVRKREKSKNNLKRKTQTVSPAEAKRACEKSGTQKKAAALLGISTRHLRTLLNGK